MVLKKISPHQLVEKMKSEKDSIYILDVRAKEKYNSYHIEESINIPKTFIFEQDEETLSHLPKDKEMIVTCTTGNSASKCAGILTEKGYNVTVLEGGVTSWKEFKERIPKGK